MEDVREVMWEGDSRERLRGFPDDVKWLFGRSLYRAQLGKRHPIGRVYVLYCHKKKSKRGIGIPLQEEKLIRDRYRDAMDHCQGKREER